MNFDRFCLENGNTMLENTKRVTRKDFPLKQQYDLYVEGTKELMKVNISRTI